MYNYFTLVIGIANKNADYTMGVLPGSCIVLNPFISVPTAFDSGSSDAIIIGNADNDDAYGETKDVSSIITLANFTAGAALGYQSGGKKVIVRYNSSGMAPTEGNAIIVLPFILVPRV